MAYWSYDSETNILTLSAEENGATICTFKFADGFTDLNDFSASETIEGIEYDYDEDEEAITAYEGFEYAGNIIEITSYVEDLSPYECYIWKMIIKRSFLFDKNIFFKPFGYEDTFFCQEFLIQARNVIKADYYLCAYRSRSGSFTSSMNLKKMLDLNSCLSALIEMKDTAKISFPVKKKLTENILSSFSYGIWCVINNDTLYNERKKIVSDLKAKVPPSKLFFCGSIKQFLISIMFRYFPYLYLRLRRL